MTYHKQRSFTAEFKAQVVLEVISGSKSCMEACRQYQISEQTLSRWKREFVDHAAMVFEQASPDSQESERMAELERLIGKLTVELEIAKKAARAAAPTSQEDASLVQQLSSLENRVAHLSDLLLTLATFLLQEGDRAFEHHVSRLETILAELGGKTSAHPPLPDQEAAGVRLAPLAKPSPLRQLNPAEERACSRMPPLIEYSAAGTYVMVSSQEGELSLVPDSPAWFEWLATLSSFRFVGQSGRFTAYRESDRKGPKRSWTAHRSIHQQRYKYHIGVTDRLTIAWLEEVAAKFLEDANPR